MYTQTAYRCSYCHKYGLSKGWIKKHEDKCFKNPATRSCASCANYMRVENTNSKMFDYDTYPECLEGIYLKNPSFDPSNPTERNLYSLKTACKYWVEKPEDDEELALYQNSKNAIETEADNSFMDNIPF